MFPGAAARPLRTQQGPERLPHLIGNTASLLLLPKPQPGTAHSAGQQERDRPGSVLRRGLHPSEGCMRFLAVLLLGTKGLSHYHLLQAQLPKPSATCPKAGAPRGCTCTDHGASLSAASCVQPGELLLCTVTPTPSPEQPSGTRTAGCHRLLLGPSNVAGTRLTPLSGRGKGEDPSLTTVSWEGRWIHQGHGVSLLTEQISPEAQRINVSVSLGGW